MVGVAEGIEGFKGWRSITELNKAFHLFGGKLIGQKKVLEVVENDSLEIDVKLHCVIFWPLPYNIIFILNIILEINAIGFDLSGQEGVFVIWRVYFLIWIFGWPLFLYFQLVLNGVTVLGRIRGGLGVDGY